MSNFLGGFATSSVLPVIDGVKVFVGDYALTVDDDGFWQAVQPAAPPGAAPVWAFISTLRGAPGTQGPPGVGEPGPQGQIGPAGRVGATGAQGPAGKSSFSYLSTALTMPPVSTSPLLVGVSDSSWMTPGLLLYVPGLGTFTVVGSPPSAGSVNLVNSGDPNNQPPGTTVQGGTVIAPAAQRGPGGPQGSAGPQGPPGPQGSSGTNVYTTLTQPLTVPPVGSPVTAFVVAPAPFAAGQIAYVGGTGGGEYFSVSAVNTTANSLTLINQGYPGGLAPGAVIPSGSNVSATGPQGPQGPAGPQGPQGVQGITGVAPTGTILMYGAVSAPGGWLTCDGSAVSRSQFPGLFSIISTTYGAGDGSSTFNLPNLAGKFPLGSSATHAMGAAGGEETHQLVLAELASHAHLLTDPGHVHPDPGHAHTAYTGSHNHVLHDPTHIHPFVSGQHAHGIRTRGGAAGQDGSLINDSQPIGDSTALATTGDSIGYAATNIYMDAVGNIGAYVNAAMTGLQSQVTNITMANSGSGTPHNNMPPYQVVNFIIKS